MTREEIEAKLAELLREHEVAMMFDVSIACLRKWRADGYGPRHVLFGGRVRYRQKDVAEWIDGLGGSAK